MAQTEQEILIGVHPVTPHIYGMWWESTDLPTVGNKKHRKLEEIVGVRNTAVDQLAKWIVSYHVHSHSLKVIEQKKLEERKKAILSKHGLERYIDKMRLLPKADKTKKGNLGEIVLIEYLKESKGFVPIIHKLQYNPNSDQSMKGDDVLLFNPKDLYSEVIYGECKFRSTPSKKVVEDIVENLQGMKRLPVSMEFIANILEDRGQTDLADSITELHIKVESGVVPVTNVGFLISTKSDARPGEDTTKQVEKYLNATNHRLVMISLGVDNPVQIVEDAFYKADSMLKTI